MKLHEKIIPVLERLPVRPEKAQPNARALAITYVMGKINEAPRFRYAGTQKAERSLRKLRDQLVALANTIRTMPIEAHEVLQAECELREKMRKENEARGIFRASDKVHQPLIFDQYALALAYATEAARQKLEKGARTSPRKPKKHAARHLAYHAVFVFQELTGIKATVVTDPSEPGHSARGPFIDFISDLFSTLKINASVETHARNAVKENRARKKRTKTPLEKA